MFRNCQTKLLKIVNPAEEESEEEAPPPKKAPAKAKPAKAKAAPAKAEESDDDEDDDDDGKTLHQWLLPRSCLKCIFHEATNFTPLMVRYNLIKAQ